MGLFDLFRSKPKASKKDKLEDMSKDDILRMVFQELAQESPSRHFAAGVVFDLVRQNHDVFEEIVDDNRLHLLQSFFAKGYIQYLNHPETLGAIPMMVDKEKNDTNPSEWNLSVIPLRGDDRAVLCFMPVKNDTVSARIVGIVLGMHGDGYYYCMLEKNENAYSDVIRHKVMAGIDKVGAVRGRGFELMGGFVSCIKSDYYN